VHEVTSPQYITMHWYFDCHHVATRCTQFFTQTGPAPWTG
jgi:hypothetical protein